MKNVEKIGPCSIYPHCGGNPVPQICDWCQYCKPRDEQIAALKSQVAGLVEALSAANEADIAWDAGPFLRSEPGMRHCACSRPLPPQYTRATCEKCMRQQALSSLPVLDLAGWRTIESAPKDGTSILGYQPWKSGYNCIDKTHWAGKSWSYQPACGECPLSTWHPTHWMPIPAPPAQGEGEV